MKSVATALMVLSGAAAPATSKFDMTEFFNGKTHAENVIRITLQRPHRLIVDSVGGRNRSGEFVLIDTVQEEGKAVRKRTWVMRPAGENHFTGSLTDATGPVDVVVSGNSATIRYTMKEGGLKIVQQVALQSDGRTLSNHVVAKKLGISFGHVDGTIRKID